MIGGHNYFDSISAESLGHASWIWILLHQPGRTRHLVRNEAPSNLSAGAMARVMALGYVLGPLFIGEPKYRRTFLSSCGSAPRVIFILLRANNTYGDPTAWTSQGEVIATALSFLDCEKYPPCLLFLMMTLGPAMILLGVFETKNSVVSATLKTFGRVPFLFYVVHLPLIHAVALALA